MSKNVSLTGGISLDNVHGIKRVDQNTFEGTLRVAPLAQGLPISFTRRPCGWTVELNVRVNGAGWHTLAAAEGQAVWTVLDEKAEETDRAAQTARVLSRPYINAALGL